MTSVDLRERPDGPRQRADDARGTDQASRLGARAGLERAQAERELLLDHDHRPAGDGRAVLDQHRRVGPQQDGARIHPLDGALDQRHLFGRGGIALADHHRIRHPQAHLAGKQLGRLVGTQRIGQHDVQGGLDEG
ncbi:hypothetical protein SDC9_196077 [bioreactor metagenome]|uniref:Uncharacterized protein n=1 Tax=bioreactor metagenome TaxID=1076179 RepID=A0A645IBF3_9ZZZZ